MFMQAWSAYGVQWPVISEFLGIEPDIPGRQLVVIPQIPLSWPGLSVANLRVGGGTMSASTMREGSVYTTRVTAPAGLVLIIGQTLPAGAQIESVTLDGLSVRCELVDTMRGREVRVQTRTDAPHTLVVIVRVE